MDEAQQAFVKKMEETVALLTNPRALSTALLFGEWAAFSVVVLTLDVQVRELRAAYAAGEDEALVTKIIGLLDEYKKLGPSLAVEIDRRFPYVETA